MLKSNAILKQLLIGLLPMVLSFSISPANAQVLVEVYVYGSATGVNAPVNSISNTVTATLKDSNGNVLGSNNRSSNSTYTSGLLISYFIPDGTTFSGRVSGNGSYTSDCRNPGNDTYIPGCRTAGNAYVAETSFGFSSSAPCTGVTYNTTTSYYNVTITVNFYAAVAKPSVPYSDNCTRSVTLSVSDATSPSFNWQVSEDALTWYTFRTSAPATISAGVNELNLATFSSPNSNRFVRVFSTDCSGKRRSGASGPFHFLNLPPSFTANASSPNCHDGQDGAITINITSGGNSFNEYQVDLINSNGTLQQGKVIGTSRIFGYPTFLIGSGTWTIRVRNYRETSSGVDPGIGTCANSTSIAIGNPPAFVISQLGSTPVSCHTNDVSSSTKKSDGSVTLNLTNGNSSFTYQYASNNGSGYSGYSAITPNSSTSLTPTLNNLPVGVYKFKATDSKLCDSNELSNISVSGPSLPIKVTELNKVDVVCRDLAQGSIDISTTNGNGGYTFAWSGPGGYSSFREDISNVYSGTYSLIVTDSKGCANNSYSRVINQPATKLGIIPVKSLYGSYNTSCLVYDGTIDLSYQNRSYSIASYEWKKNGALLLPTPTNNEHLSGLGPGSYQIKVKDSKGCEASAAIAMSANPGITISTKATSNYNGYNTKCNSPASLEGEGQVIVTNSFGALRYSWNHDPDLNSSWASELGPGTYHVSVTDGNHCVDDDNLIIIPPPSIQPHLQVTSNYNGHQISCSGASDGTIESFPLNGYGSYQYSWQHNSILTTKFANGLHKGTYTVTVKDGYGCTANESVNLKDPPSMKFLFEKRSYNGADLSCYGKKDGEITLTVLNGIGSNSLYRYNWSNNASTKDLASLGKGDYRVSVTDGNSCVKDSSISIIAPSELSIEVEHTNNFNGYDVKCHGETNGEVTALASGGTGDYSYLWSNGVNTNTNSELGIGYYSISITDENGCKQAESVTITQPTPFTASLTLDQPVSCFGLSDGKMTLNGDGGVSPYSYSRGQSSWEKSNVFSDLRAGDNSFFVMDSNGCTVSLSETISEPAPLHLSFADKINATCNDPVGSVKAVVTGGNGTFTYSWIDETTHEPKNQGNVLLNALAGIYRVDVKDSKDCAIADRTEISSIGGAAFDIIDIDPVTCFGDADGSASIAVTTGIIPYAFLWSNGETSDHAGSLSAGKYFATVIDGLGCKTIKQVTITSPEQLNASYAKKLPLCVENCNGQINATISGGVSPYSYAWINRDSKSNELINLCAGTYELQIIDANNCLFDEKIVLSDPEPLVVTSQITRPSCQGRCDGAITVSGGGGAGAYRFEWDDRTVASELSNLCPGELQVIMTDGNNCSIYHAFVIPEGNPISIDLGRTATLCVGQTKRLDAGQQWINSSWTSDTGFFSEETKIFIKDAGNYFFKGIDDRGCIALDTFKLETSLDLLKAEFLLSADAVVGDTLVAIDISWPLPEKIDWNYPASFKQISSPSNEILYVQPLEAGTFTLGMKSFLAECQDMREKTITVLANVDEGNGAGRLGYEDLIREFSLSPNPNHGEFSVKLSFSEEVQARLRVVQYPSGIVLAESNQESSDSYEVAFELTEIPQGSYVVLLDARNQQRFIRFLKE